MSLVQLARNVLRSYCSTASVLVTARRMSYDDQCNDDDIDIDDDDNKDVDDAT